MRRAPLPLESVRLAAVALCVALALVGGCADELPTPPTAAPAIAAAGQVAVRVVVPAAAGPGLREAGEDLVAALAATTGATAAPLVVGAVPASGVVVAVELGGNAEARGLEGFRIDRHGFPSGAVGLRVRAATELGASHGLRAVCEALGVHWHHPEETFVPAADAARTLPWAFDGAVQAPRFAFRGLHEHTQHPVPASDFVLQPAVPGHAEMARNWIRWIARNRNNVASFHMLKTVPLDTWLPELATLATFARERGVRLGMVTSFADQQQNNYKHIDESKQEAGAPVPDDVQIRASLDRLVGAGIDWIAFQIGTSEFTKPEDARVLGWLQTALDHLAAAHPGTDAFAWIHTTCSLKDETGGYFYHLPLQSPAALGAWVHTTMFYTLEHPAPVYDCETFHQQRDFATAAAGTRPLVYFPETAWWLGFDNNVPLALPITGWSRHYDAAGLPDAYSGHVTFTSGREWGYWMYDHHVLRLGWDAQTSWRDYLDDIAPLFGAHGAQVADVLERWAERQMQDLYVTNPMLTFYLAGELPQDEIGAAAGILARRPKPAFATVLAYDDAQWKAFVQGDLADLAAMEQAYAGLLAELPAPAAEAAPADLSARLYAELHATLWLYVRRIEHTRRLYQGVVALRPWHEAKLAAGPTGEPDLAIRDAAKAAAAVELSAAVTIGDAVAVAVVDGEQRYRYPLSMLARPKPQTLTSYPFGYLEQTSTAFFWRRREVQLAALVDKATGGGKQAWTAPAPGVVVTSGKEQTSLVAPDHPVAKGALPGFVPRLLWGASAAPSGGVRLAIATDFDANGLPDAGSEQDVDLKAAGADWKGTLSPFSLEVQDSAGNAIGTLHLLDAQFSATLTLDGSTPTGITAVTVSGATPTDAFLALMKTVGGIDDAGASALLKSVFGVPQTEPLPAQLPVAFAFAPVPLDG
ncbi:MAG: hypothetical protein RIT45_990 [Pseudomonadota bacterium]